MVIHSLRETKRVEESLQAFLNLDLWAGIEKVYPGNGRLVSERRNLMREQV